MVETVGVGAMPLAETEPTARVATSKASKTWRDNAKTEGHYKRKKREENVVIAFRKRFLWHALDPAVRKAKEPRIGAKEPKLPSSTGDISFDEGEWASLEARAKSSANARKSNCRDQTRDRQGEAVGDERWLAGRRHRGAVARG